MTEACRMGKLRKRFHLHRTFTWCVDFRSLPTDGVFSTCSSSFTFGEATWCLRLHPNGRETNHILDSVVLEIVRLRSNVRDHHLHCSAGIENLIPLQGPNCFSQWLDFDEEFNSDEIFFMKRSVLMNEFEFIDSNGNITFFTELKTESDCVHASSHTELFETIPSAVEKPGNFKDFDALSQSFRDVLLSGENHDVTLKVIDKEFRAHQDVLRARCPVFKSMLSHDMMEKKSGVVDIPDCDPAAFQQFLIYIYSGKVDTLDQNNMLGLYYVADKYNVPPLKEACRDFIKTSLSSRVICDIIELASNHNDSGLLECATEYFTDNMEEILESVEWQSFMKESANKANEVLIKATKRLKNKIKMSHKDTEKLCC